MSDRGKRGYLQRRVDDVRVLVLGPRVLPDEEFDAHVREAVEMAGSVRVVLVVVVGSPHMTAERRAKLDRAGLVPVPTAVMTDSVAIRAILTAMRWLGGNVQPFPMDGELQALEFLAVPAHRREHVAREVRSMIAEWTGVALPVRDGSRSGLARAVERIERIAGARADKIRKKAAKL